MVIPVRDEASNIEPLFRSLATCVTSTAEVLLVYDDPQDSTLVTASECANLLPWALRMIPNTLGPGPANAICAGFRSARGDAVVVIMADLSDDLPLIERMYRRLQAGDDIVCGSRYMRGGQQIGGPLLKRLMSRLAGVTLWLVGLPTHDATNAFKMYRRDVFTTIHVEGNGGFEISLEIVVKSWLAGKRIGELPSTWTDRNAGSSKFRMLKWLPRYLRWYLYALYASIRVRRRMPRKG